MVNENDRFKRATGVKSSINNIINGEFVKITDEFKPSYVVGLTGKQMARANVIGIVVTDINNNESNADFMIDDSTGSITVRTFDEKVIGKLENIGTGSTVMIIGKPREFNDSIYLVPEIIRELKDSKWIDLRKKELSVLEKGIPIKTPEPRAPITTEESFAKPVEKVKEVDPVAMEGKSKYVESAGSEKETVEKTEEEIKSESDSSEENEKVDMDDFAKELNAESTEENKSEEPKEDSVEVTPKEPENLNDPSKAVKTDFEPKENPFDKIVRVINDLDEGRGADFEAVVQKSGIEKAEDIVNNLLLEGEIFEISPGKLKVL